MLDDTTSILVLKAAPDGIDEFVQQALNDPSGPLGRPVTIATFLLERTFLDGTLATSKKSNLLLHLINSALLYALMLRLGTVVGYKRISWIATISAGLWLVSPLQVSTVLYAVQRMAMLAAFFFLLLFHVYLCWRRRFLEGRAGVVWILLGICVLVLGVYSKENAIVGVPIILLAEVLWLSSTTPDAGRLQSFAAVCLLGLLLFALVYLGLEWSSLTAHYHYRYFSPGERLMTEARVLWDYVGQFYWPDIRLMGLYHDDYPVSKALFGEVSPLPAIGAWLFVLALMIFSLGRDSGRRLVFCVSAFLVGHSVESSILPLELYFEHRNYLPSIALALLVFTAMGELKRRLPALHAPLIAWGMIGLILLIMMTSSQAQVWSSRRLIALNAVAFHPESYRANVDMAEIYAEVGDIERALAHSVQAHDYRSEYVGDLLIRNAALACIAGAANTDILSTLSGELDPLRPLSDAAALNVLADLVSRGRCSANLIDTVLSKLTPLYLEDSGLATASPNVYLGLGALAFYGGHFAAALDFANKNLALAPVEPKGLLMALHFALLNERYGEADALKSRLSALQAEGKLSRQQEEQFAAYEEQ